MSSGNTLTDSPGNNVLPANWPFVNLPHKINHLRATVIDNPTCAEMGRGDSQGKISRLQDITCTVVCSFSTLKTFQRTALYIFLYKCPTIFRRWVHRRGIDKLWQIAFQKCFTNLGFNNV